MMAKMETHCLVVEEDWHAIDNHIKGKIVTDIRDRFVIPDGATYDKQALKRANKPEAEDEHGEKMSLLALWIKSHMGKDGSFLSGTDTNDFVDDVNAKVEQLRLKYPTKSQLEIEIEAFEEIMYQDEIPDRPVGYGLGLKRTTFTGCVVC
ncbi:Extended synaptotagmin-2 [Bienertia sinuspersici]